MELSDRFYNFIFTPKKLTEERKKVEGKFGDIERDLVNQRSKIDLPKLLESIRSLSFHDLGEFAKKLTKMQVRILLYEYPFPNESKETREKINQILLQRYSSEVARIGWDLYQHDLHDLFLIKLLRNSYKKESGSFLGIEESFLEPFAGAMESKNGIVNGLIPFLTETKTKSVDVFKKWKVKQGSRLEKELIQGMLKTGLARDHIVNRDGTEYIVDCLNHFPTEQYKELLKVYIEEREYKNFHYSIMHQAIRRLLDPHDKKANWGFLSDNALEQVYRWLLQNKLKEFFEKDINNERFNYWKQFIDYGMEDVTLLKEPLVAFIYFSEFVVVEYGKIGAAYFYHREGFDKFIFPRTNELKFRQSRSNATKENMLKDRSEKLKGVPLFINKEAHIGSWNWKFNRYMQKYINGNFDRWDHRW